MEEEMEEEEAKELLNEMVDEVTGKVAEEVMMEEEDMEGIEEVEEEVMTSSRTPEKPWGAMSERTHRCYKSRLACHLLTFPPVQQVELALCLAGAYSHPWSLPSPLRPSKMAITMSPDKLATFLAGEAGIPPMGEVQRKVALESLYSILCPPCTGKAGRKAECLEPELVVDDALLATVLADPTTTMLLKSLGLEVDPALLKSRDDDRQVSIALMEVAMRKARVTSDRPKAVQHTAMVAAELGLSIGKLGSIQRLRDAVK